MQSRKFLVIITVFAVLMLTFPYYSRVFYSNDAVSTEIAPENTKQMEFIIEGVTCENCENHVTNEILKLEGIGDTKVSYQDGNAIVEFDKLKVNDNDISKAINSTGYTVTETKKL